MYNSVALALLGIAGASLFSAVGSVFLVFSEKKIENLSDYLVSISVGTIFGGVFVHLLYRINQSYGYNRISGLLVVFGIVTSMILERVIHWHCHNKNEHVEAFSYVLVAGDAVHNFLDGLLVASSFIAGLPTGIATTVAVLAHKIPKEAGDFGILVDSGFSSRKAVIFNVAVSLFMFLGAGVAFAVLNSVSGANKILLPLVTGNFVYIAGTDLLPRLKDRQEIPANTLLILVGLLLSYAVTFVRQIVV